MSSSAAGWKRLNCPFFEASVRSVLDSYFAENGFKHHSQTPVGGIVYSNGAVFIEISYEPETYPNYSPRVVIGIGQVADDPNWRMTALPVWFLIPPDRPEAKFPFWSFTTTDDLVKVLKRIQAEVLEPYAKPLLIDPPSLRKNVEAFKGSAGLRT